MGKVTTTIAVLAALIATSGCHRKDAASAPQPAPALSPKKPTRDWATLIVGDWVSSSVWPAGGPEDNCATDTDFDFTAGGAYGTDTDEGHWTIVNDQLTTTITAANPDGDIGPPLTPLAKPDVIQSRLIDIKGPVITAFTGGETEYWYRCPRPKKHLSPA